MCNKNRNNEWKTSERARRKAKEHIPKAIKPEGEEKCASPAKRKDDVALQNFREKKKEQKRNNNNNWEHNNVGRAINNHNDNIEEFVITERKRANHVASDNTIIISADESEISHQDTNIPSAPPINSEKIKSIIQSYKNSRPKPQVIPARIPDTLEDDIAKKYKELTNLNANNFAESEVLIKELQQSCLDMAEQNVIARTELQSSYDELLEEEFETKKIRFSEKIILDTIKHLTNQVKRENIFEVEEEDLLKRIPDEECFSNSQDIMKSLLSGTLETANHVIPMMIKKNKIEDDCIFLRRSCARQAGLVKSTIQTAKNKSKVGYHVLETSNKLLKMFITQMNDSQNEKYTKNHNTTRKQWLKKLSNFTRLEDLFLSQISNMTTVIKRKQDELQLFASKSISDIDLEINDVKGNIKKAKLQHQTDVKNDQMYKTVEQEKQTTENLIQSVIQSNQSDIEKLENLRSQLATSYNLIEKVTPLKLESEELGYRIYQANRELNKAEIKQLEVKELYRHRCGLILKEEEKQALLQEKLDDMKQNIPVLETEISNSLIKHRKISQKLQVTSENMANFYNNNNNKFLIM